jgi:hypothetical protein
VVEIGRLLRPFNGQVDLADLFEGLGGVLEPRGELPVAGVGANDGVDVAVENGQSPSVPVDHEPLVRMSRRPAVLQGPCPEAGLEIGESCSIGRRRRDRRLQDVDGLMHLPTMRI